VRGNPVKNDQRPNTLLGCVNNRQ